MMVQKGEQLTWLQAALPADYALTKVQETDAWILYSTPAKNDDGFSWRSGNDVALAQPVTPGMRITDAAGNDIPFTALAGVVPRFTLPSDGVFRVEHDLPNRNAIVMMMLLGGLVLVLLVVASRRARSRES